MRRVRADRSASRAGRNPVCGVWNSSCGRGDSCEPFSFSRKRVVAHRAKRRLWEIHVRKIITSQPHEGRPTAVKSKSVKSHQTKARVPRREQPLAPQHHGQAGRTGAMTTGAPEATPPFDPGRVTPQRQTHQKREPSPKSHNPFHLLRELIRNGGRATFSLAG